MKAGQIPRKSNLLCSSTAQKPSWRPGHATACRRSDPKSKSALNPKHPLNPTGTHPGAREDEREAFVLRAEGNS